MEDHFDVLMQESPIILMKTVKSDKELAGFRRANINDGVVWVRLMMYVEECLQKGWNITELSVSEKMSKLKAEHEDFVCESFESIVAYGSNAAIVHYAPTEDTNKEIFTKGFLLIDSGTHYKYGTTDITRTLVCGELTDEEKVRFTQVLKGMIAVSVAQFEVGTTGAEIDELARQFLKKDGCDYRHGTGHGIGSVMCVHEDGVKFSPKFVKPIVAGSVCSDEPGYYKEGEYGIRIENVLVCEQITDKKLFFWPLTLVPIDLEAIELTLLTEVEKKWINNYHKNIKIILKDYLSDDEFLWLENKYYEI